MPGQKRIRAPAKILVGLRFKEHKLEILKDIKKKKIELLKKKQKFL